MEHGGWVHEQRYGKRKKKRFNNLWLRMNERSLINDEIYIRDSFPKEFLQYFSL